MRLLWAPMIVFVGLAGGSPLPAQQSSAAPSARDILDRAIQAHGGKEVLARYKGLITKSRGQFFGWGRAIDYTATSTFLAPHFLRLEASGRNEATRIRVLRMMDGKQGWRIVNDKEEAMNEEQVHETREQIHLTFVTRLVPLLEPDYQLSTLAVSDSRGQPLLGLRVQHKGYRDIQMFFDRHSGLLYGTRVRVKDVYGTNQESLAETTYSRYRKVKDMEVAFKVVTQYDGEPYIEYEVTEAIPVEKLDEKLFQKP